MTTLKLSLYKNTLFNIINQLLNLTPIDNPLHFDLQKASGKIIKILLSRRETNEILKPLDIDIKYTSWFLFEGLLHRQRKSNENRQRTLNVDFWYRRSNYNALCLTFRLWHKLLFIRGLAFCCLLFLSLIPLLPWRYVHLNAEGGAGRVNDSSPLYPSSSSIGSSKDRRI